MSAGAFLEPDDPRWMEAVRAMRHHDVYHLPGYAKTSALADGGRPIAYHARDGAAHFLAPLIVRPVPADLSVGAGWHDVTSPYGYPSPLCSSTDPAVQSRMLAGFCDALRKAGFVSAFLRLHPLLPPPAPAPSLESAGLVVEQGATLYADLSPPLEDLQRGLRRSLRRDLKWQRETGFTARIDDWDHYEAFIAVYLENMARVQSSGYYRFPRAYFDAMRQQVPQAHLAAVFSPEGELAAAEMFFEEDGIVQGHIAGTSTKFLKAAPSTMLYDAVQTWAKQRGNRALNYGMGIGGKRDSVFHFKQGFATHEAPYRTLRIILDPLRYRALVDEWTRAGGEGADDPQGFFPHYRKPLPRPGAA